MATGVQLAERDDARKGALYFLGRTHIEPAPTLDLGIVNNFVGSTEILNDIKAVASALIPATVTSRLSVSVDIMRKIEACFVDFFESIKSHLKDLLGDVLVGVEWIGEFTSWAVSALVGSLSSVIPGWGYVQSAGDLYSGVKQAVMQSKEFIVNLWGRRGVHLLDGMPTDIADALARHSAAGVGGGLKNIGIASVSIGLEAAGDAVGGAGSIVSLVTGILQRIANLIDWAIQRFRMRSVLDTARQDWESKAGMCEDHAQFARWFRRNTLCTPITAALVLSSGFVAHPYRFLLLLNPDDTITSQAEFDKGVLYIEKLKGIAKRYIADYMGTYKLVFESDDPLVASRLNQF